MADPEDDDSAAKLQAVKTHLAYEYRSISQLEFAKRSMEEIVRFLDKLLAERRGQANNLRVAHKIPLSDISTEDADGAEPPVLGAQDADKMFRSITHRVGHVEGAAAQDTELQTNGKGKGPAKHSDKTPAHSTGKESSMKKRPRGRAPKGMQWDNDAGEWVPENSPEAPEDTQIPKRYKTP